MRFIKQQNVNTPILGAEVLDGMKRARPKQLTRHSSHKFRRVAYECMSDSSGLRDTSTACEVAFCTRSRRFALTSHNRQHTATTVVL